MPASLPAAALAEHLALQHFRCLARKGRAALLALLPRPSVPTCRLKLCRCMPVTRHATFCWTAIRCAEQLMEPAERNLKSANTCKLAECLVVILHQCEIGSTTTQAGSLFARNQKTHSRAQNPSRTLLQIGHGVSAQQKRTAQELDLAVNRAGLRANVWSGDASCVRHPTCLLDIQGPWL